tara:strand:+ start:787 stop:1059 length:273 start_codon:yes stop_codon:yes gene_type:complete
MTEKPELDIAISDPQPPTYPDVENAHQKMMQDPAYAIATHEHILNKYASLLEEMSERIIALEDKVNTISFPDTSDDPIHNYPEVKMHQNR